MMTVKPPFPRWIPAELRGFFQKRQWVPFEFQLKTWRAYLAGNSGLVHAPTGTGKTLSVWLGPVIEYIKEGRGKEHEPWDAPLTVLWITPLRALAGDTADSLREPIEELGLKWRVEMRTGDTSSHIKQRQLARLPSALVTTPESLSLLLSYEDTARQLLTTRCIIVDEWHELMGTKRGVQTELGLAYLRRRIPDLRIWGLSATIGNLGEAAQVLLGHSPAASGKRSVLVTGKLPKRTEIVTMLPGNVERFPWSGHLGFKSIDGVIEAVEKARTTLLFTNTRSQTELWFRAILDKRPDWEHDIALHHGSLDREVRDEVENRLRAGTIRCVVCTSSLDLGVDFPTVDQVLQVGSPKGVARLLQRAGRSGHQPGGVSRVLCVPTHAFELVEFSAARMAAQQNRIESRIPLDRPLDVLVQHCVTMAAGGGFVGEELFDEVSTTHAFQKLSRQEWQWVLDFVTHGGEALRAYSQYARVVNDNGKYSVSSDDTAKWHRLSIGTITSDNMVAVKYQTGGVLGTVEESFVARMHPGDRFVFAGKLLELIRLRDLIATVKRATAKSGNVPKWMGGRLPLSSELAAAVRERLREARDHIYVDDEMKSAEPVLEIQNEWSMLPGPDELVIEQIKIRDGWVLVGYPFAGRLVNEGLAALVAFRISRKMPRTLSVVGNDYGFGLTSPTAVQFNEQEWRELLTTENLLDDLLSCLNASELARRRFRDIARVAGLLITGYPGARRTARQVQASSGLLYDVFMRYDPANLLLDQARREVLEAQLEVQRLRRTLEAIEKMKIVICNLERLTPFSFPIWAEFVQDRITSERWSDRISRMVQQLEAETREG